MEISVVTGTYSRINYLKGMVESVRKSIGTGIPYEIVVVDSGSKDGTIEWCGKQPDIKFIQQRRLLGAVKAFNEGAFAATGRYVILANDDVEFLDESILCALSFMQDNPTVGIGCFYQDRGNLPWYVDTMSAVLDGKPVTTYYGQVCIVPKWLGDKVGWWGDYLHTYGGDNELSCNVIEQGYKIEPVPCAYIHDAVAADSLRLVNNNRKKINNTHPDTYAWLQKWTRNGKLGPNIRLDPIDIQNQPERLKRIFYTPIYEPGHPIQKQTKQGLRRSLSKTGLVVEYDYMHGDLDFMCDVACAFDPDMFVMQLQDYSVQYEKLLLVLREQHPNAKFINWNGDYHPDTLFHADYMSLMKHFDLVGVVAANVKKVWDKAGINWFYWQIGYEEHNSYVNPQYAGTSHDIVFLANGYSSDRIALATFLRQLRNVNVGIYGSWPKSFGATGNTLYDFSTGAWLYSHSKISIGDSQWPDAIGFVSNRLFQALAAKSFMLQQYFDGLEDLLGFVDGKHLVVWRTVKDLEIKIKYYLANESERKRIAEQGYKFVVEHHSFDKRVEELYAKIATC